MKLIATFITVIAWSLIASYILLGCQSLPIKETPPAPQACPSEPIMVYIPTPMGMIPVFFETGEMDRLLQEQREHRKERKQQEEAPKEPSWNQTKEMGD